MLKVLVPTDFSNCASNALKAAVYLANKSSGHVDVVHLYEVVRTTGHFKSMDQILRDDALRDMEAFVTKVADLLTGDSTLGSHVMEGRPGEMIDMLARRQSSDLIIMGTQGSSNLNEVFLGSTAVAVIQKSSKPTLVVPDRYPFEGFKRAVLAVDDHEELPNMLFLNYLAQIIPIEIHLLHVGEKALKRTLVAKYKAELAAVKLKIAHVDSASDVSGGINSYVEKVGADLIVMVRRNKSFLERLISGSFTKRRLFDTQHPVLILHE